MSDPAPQQSPDAGSAKPRRDYLYLSACSIVACVVVRAPSIFEEGKIPLIDLKLKLNAGWILVFGPLLIACAIAAITYRDCGAGSTEKEDQRTGMSAPGRSAPNRTASAPRVENSMARRKLPSIKYALSARALYIGEDDDNL
jgi:hypothetical protein